MPEKTKLSVYFGGWYQRTTLHLTEIADFFTEAKSDLPLSKERLKKLHTGLELVKVSRKAGYLEYVRAETKEGIEIQYYEDGLYILKQSSSDIDEAKEKLKSYYDDKFAPAIAYIFSLGAPTPKELANIKTVHPIAVGVIDKDPEEFALDAQFGEIYSTIDSPELTVKKTPGFIFLIAKPEYKDFVEGLVEMQIFFREFKDQLQKYLDIHRKLWEEISEIKERKLIRGREVEKVRLQLDAYQKTINLISSRINQMGAYVHTRADIAKEMKLADHLSNVFQYKFDVLTNTHGYIKEIWVMTNNYLAAAIGVIAEIKGQATNKSIQSLQLITTYGVVGGIIGYLSRDSLPKVTSQGMIYFGLLMLVTFIVNLLVKAAYSGIRYKLKFVERVKNI
ncbi:hypothetical protein A3K29_05255 [Candidatus Collierbacteria bacterium RIFOXYB2_FULL_46_14]|uniref:Uncharacterized protein n=1 Tax=Candidatus Collierbacteria bacterium GW2011_GWA2_46_26 TaxID=1618381 RepID=A0A0G1RTW9_9BACT|nr:MAG: hypothetical protein UX47_C0004G0063 [Candidatus Collierbacteria bacterium GW2011_GWA2_46_26]OGD73501.1 MAG: hypothetical protein A3K29_05255 [Candidatus Collierbacteria bacterium RIFOXYB2_FULL_46_14]OGD76543.1 MAG: hypothetical protein A3K43_05255 [Candidatus Collierbacteria bacterium RIFOXYA2_FULL_46_20]OGD77879.1 MAG: hypothetical protein A3K39_05255 [Candidatus Collierbacteria bacterium RIFOXYC2_FULL_43_15]OGD81169.1 MAG: hypothetical protein A2320_05750 [Pseudomonadales bacterium G